MFRTYRRQLAALLTVLSAVPLLSMQDTSRIEISTGPSTDASAIRVMHASVDSTVLRLHVAAVGQDGRVPSSSLVGSWTVAVRCRDSVTGIVATPEPLPRGLERATSSATVLCLDNSAASNGTAERVVGAMRLFGYGLTDADTIAVLAYDHAITELTPFVSGSALPTSLFDAPAQQGLSAMYTAAVTGIAMLETMATPTRDLIVVSATDDNASITHDLASVVQRAREAGVRVSVIRVGQSSLGYVGRYLAGATGGMYAHVHKDSAVAAATMARHIVMARRNYVDIAIDVPTAYTQAPDLDIAIEVLAGMSIASDSIRLPLRPRQYPQQRILVATFSNATDTALQSFQNQLAMAAESLADDSSATLELIGHVDVEASRAMQQSTQRATLVADAMVRLGAPADRIRVRGEGAARPLYAFELLPWHRRLNNRVELRRRTDDAYPYDVVVAKVRTEQQAQEAISLWQERGFNAYFDSMIANGEPAYRVLLWGYTTRSEAEAAAAIIRTEHKISSAYVD